jgi:hypothetical protein
MKKTSFIGSCRKLIKRRIDQAREGNFSRVKLKKLLVRDRKKKCSSVYDRKAFASAIRFVLGTPAGVRSQLPDFAQLELDFGDADATRASVAAQLKHERL